MKLPYNEYKDTNHYWLKEIPSHWDNASLRLISRRYSGGTPDKKNSGFWQDGTVPWLNSGAVNQELIKEPTTHITVDALKQSSAKWIPTNAIIIALAGQGKTKGTAALTCFRTTCNQSMAAVIFEKDSPKFMYWWLKSQYKNIRGMASDDGRDGLNLEMIGSIPCPMPPIEEQTQIAKFLDHKTAQIDRLIEKKKALIEKLNEQRIAMITQAVTKGLNPNAEMKDSEVDWLGEVPTHWDIMQFKDRCVVVSGQVDPTDPEYEELPLIAPDHIEKETGKLLELSSAKEQGAISGKYLFASGDLLYSKIRPELNKLCIAPSDGLCSADMYAIRTVKDIHIRFLYYLMLSKYFHQFAILESMRVAMPKINREALGALKILVPPLNEQKEIVNHLEDSIEKIDSMKAVNNKTIERLNEYRTALITAAVTGKINVQQVEVPQEF